MTHPAGSDERDGLARLHARRGWRTIALWLLLGVVLEALHGLKVGWYLEPTFETRRLLWRLAHAHGTLGGLLHLGLSASAALLGPGRARGLASAGLTAGGVLLPCGFLLGGAFPWSGDPGLGIALVPVGAAAWLLAALAAARAVR